MSLTDLIATFNTVRRKKNLDRTLLTAASVFSMIEENLSEAGSIITVRSGDPASPIRASILLISGSGNNRIRITLEVPGVIGNTVNFVIDASTGTLNRPLSLGAAPSYDGDEGDFIVLTLATDGSGDIANTNTWEAVSLLPDTEDYVLTSNIGDVEEAFDALSGALTDGQDGDVGNEGDIYFGEGGFYISTGESTITQSYWERVTLYEDSGDLTTQTIINTAGNPFMVLEPVGNQYGSSREVQLVTQGSTSYPDLRFGMFDGIHGQKVKLTWLNNIGPTTSTLTLVKQHEGGEIRDHTGSASICDLIFESSGLGTTWVELEYELHQSEEYWKLIGYSSNGLRYTPKIIRGAQTACIVFSEAYPTFDLQLGECPHVHVEIYDDGAPSQHNHSFTISNGTIPRQRCYIKVVDVPMLSADPAGMLALDSNNIYRQDMGGLILLSPPTFDADNAYLLLEWDQVAGRWVVLESVDVTLIDD